MPSRNFWLRCQIENPFLGMSDRIYLPSTLPLIPFLAFRQGHPVFVETFRWNVFMEGGQSLNVGRKRGNVWLLELSTLTSILFLEGRGQSIRNLVYGERGLFLGLVVESDGWGSRRPNGTSLQEWEMDLGFLTQCGVLAKISSCLCHHFLEVLAPHMGCDHVGRLFLKTIRSSLNRFGHPCCFALPAKRLPRLVSGFS